MVDEALQAQFSESVKLGKTLAEMTRTRFSFEVGMQASEVSPGKFIVGVGWSDEKCKGAGSAVMFNDEATAKSVFDMLTELKLASDVRKEAV